MILSCVLCSLDQKTMIMNDEADDDYDNDADDDYDNDADDDYDNDKEEDAQC